MIVADQLAGRTEEFPFSWSGETKQKLSTTQNTIEAKIAIKFDNRSVLRKKVIFVIKRAP